LWQVVLGMPLENYTEDWDRSDPERLVVRFNSPDSPLTLGYGQDSSNDDAALVEITNGVDGYYAFVSGMLSQVASFILAIKEYPKAITITQTKSLERDGFVQLECRVHPPDECIIPLLESPNEDGPAARGTDSQPDEVPKPNAMDFIFKYINLETIDRLNVNPMSQIKSGLTNIIDSVFHMDPNRFFAHFENYEDDVIRIFGFLTVHLLNEPGRGLENAFQQSDATKVFGHIFGMYWEALKSYVPASVLADYRDLLVALLDGLAPQAMVEAFQTMPPERYLEYFMQGAEKALTDLGMPFDELAGDLFEELQLLEKAKSPGKEPSPEAKLKAERARFIVMQEASKVVFGLSLLPAHLFQLVFVTATKNQLNYATDYFHEVNESIKRIIDQVEHLRA
jgi:hypothetical protein